MLTYQFYWENSSLNRILNNIVLNAPPISKFLTVLNQPVDLRCRPFYQNLLVKILACQFISH